MIYTITLNPALDRTLWVEKIRPDDSNRIEREQRYAGGKGTDVSRVLTALGVNNKALGLVGGFAGEELEGRLLNEGISCDFTRISGETRTNIIVNDISTGSQTVFSARGPEIYRKLIEIAKTRGAWVILDTDGDALRVGILGIPDAIKPNIHELSRLVDEELKGIDKIARDGGRV